MTVTDRPSGTPYEHSNTYLTYTYSCYPIWWIVYFAVFCLQMDHICSHDICWLPSRRVAGVITCWFKEYVQEQMDITVIYIYCISSDGGLSWCCSADRKSRIVCYIHVTNQHPLYVVKWTELSLKIDQVYAAGSGCIQRRTAPLVSMPMLVEDVTSEIQRTCSLACANWDYKRSIVGYDFLAHPRTVTRYCKALTMYTSSFYCSAIQ